MEYLLQKNGDFDTKFFEKNKKCLGRFGMFTGLISRTEKTIVYVRTMFEKGGSLMERYIQRAKEGDSEAFIIVMQSCMQSMYKVAKSILKTDEDVADAVQETILCCWEKIGQLREAKFYKTWITRILINKCNDIWRERQQFVYEETLLEKASKEESYQNVEWKELLDSIDEKYRLVLILYYVEGFKTSEISQMLQLTESAVRSRLARGREKLSREYQIENDGRLWT